jgi:Lar family restriction alleviation protein
MKDSESSNALLPCPFCGGQAEIVRVGTRSQSTIIDCSDCGCRLESADEGDQYGDAWNRRATHEPATALETIAAQLQHWLDFHASQTSTPSDDATMVQMPVYPTRRTIKAWVSALRSAPPPDVVRDAERYRWLRDFGHTDLCVMVTDTFTRDTMMFGVDLDSAIDAARTVSTKCAGDACEHCEPEHGCKPTSQGE